MKLHFIGTSHGYPEENRFCSCTVLETSGKYYIIDAGAPIVDLLPRNNIPLDKIAGIFITHNHDDHYIGLAALTVSVNDLSRNENIRIPVYVPYFGKFFTMEYLLYGFRPHHHRMRYRQYGPGVIFNDGAVKITAIPVRHMWHSYAFMIEADGKTVLFSGDLVRDMPDYPKVLFNREFRCLVLEAAHTDMDSEGVIDKVHRSRVQTLIINHIAPRNPADKLQRLFDAVPEKECIAATDGMVIEL